MVHFEDKTKSISFHKVLFWTCILRWIQDMVLPQARIRYRYSTMQSLNVCKSALEHSLPQWTYVFVLP